MNEPLYSVKEIMDIQFKGLDAKLDDIKHTLKEQNANSEIRFTRIEREIDDIKTQQAKVMTAWGIFSVLGATVFTFVLNKFI